jgi:hypothetical protein
MLPQGYNSIDFLKTFEVKSSTYLAERAYEETVKDYIDQSSFFDLTTLPAFLAADFIVTTVNDAFFVPESDLSLEDRVDEIISTGRLKPGEPLNYKIVNEIWSRNIESFNLTMDRSVVSVMGGVALPTPLDNTKALGHVVVRADGSINNDIYDFLPVRQTTNASFKLDASISENVMVAIKKSKTFVRNQLNGIAILQHGPGTPFTISFEDMSGDSTNANKR